jgi:uncharacterized protein YndB with AHSA1/START domain
MNNCTKIMIRKPAAAVFEAFVDPQQIGKFWFSSSSERWEKGKTITLRYEEYGAQGDIKILDIIPNERITFAWVYGAEDHVVTIALKPTADAGTIVEITEEGFAEGEERLLESMLDNKEGWVYMLTCLKGYLEYGADLRAAIVK